MTADLDVRIAEMMGWRRHVNDSPKWATDVPYWTRPNDPALAFGAALLPKCSTSLDAVVAYLVPFMAEQGQKSVNVTPRFNTTSRL